MVVVVDRETKTARRTQEVIRHICKGSKLRATRIDIRKKPTVVCNELKAAFREVNTL